MVIIHILFDIFIILISFAIARGLWDLHLVFKISTIQYSLILLCIGIIGAYFIYDSGYTFNLGEQKLHSVLHK